MKKALKFNAKREWFRFSILILVIIIYNLLTYKSRKHYEEYFKTLNLQLTGVIIDGPYITEDHGCSIIRVKVLNSNIKYLDPRGKEDYYYCIIKDSIAQLYQFGLRDEVYKGDTIEDDSKNRAFYSIKNGVKNKHSLLVNSDDIFMNLVHKRFENF